MGYGCPPPLAGGGVTPGDADTRVITALLAAAAVGGWDKVRVCVCVSKGEGSGRVFYGGGGGWAGSRIRSDEHARVLNQQMTFTHFCLGFVDPTLNVHLFRYALTQLSNGPIEQQQQLSAVMR